MNINIKSKLYYVCSSIQNITNESTFENLTGSISLRILPILILMSLAREFQINSISYIITVTLLIPSFLWLLLGILLRKKLSSFSHYNKILLIGLSLLFGSVAFSFGSIIFVVLQFKNNTTVCNNVAIVFLLQIAICIGVIVFRVLFTNPKLKNNNIGFKLTKKSSYSVLAILAFAIITTTTITALSDAGFNSALYSIGFVILWIFSTIGMYFSFLVLITYFFRFDYMPTMTNSKQ